MYRKGESIGQFSNKCHGSKWDICLVMDEHRNGPLRNVGNKNSHILQIVPQNVLKCDWIVITVTMSLLNSIEYLFELLIVDFSPKT